MKTDKDKKREALWRKNNKEVVKNYAKKYAEDNKDKLGVYRKEYYIKNKKRIQERDSFITEEKKEANRLRAKAWYENNKKKAAESRKDYIKRNKHKKRKWSADRKAMKLSATVKGFNEEIEEFYIKAHELEKTTGVKYHVDHIIPLKNEKVCGLHAPWNLRVITAEENLKKGNKITQIC